MGKEQRIEHRYYSAPDKQFLFQNPDSWFYQYGLSVLAAVFNLPDVRQSRFLIAQMLTEAWNQKLFFEENSHFDPEPYESDRMLTIAWLQQLASVTGLINSEEIREIQDHEGQVNLARFYPREPGLLNNKRVLALTSKWDSENLLIGLYHGSFDPPTVVHLGCATEAYGLCDRLVIGFDNEYLLRRRKGPDRPKSKDLKLDRRRIFQGFWMVDATFELRANDLDDVDQYVSDYRELHISRVFLTADQAVIPQRLEKIRKAGAEPVSLHYRGDELHGTDILELAKKYGFL